MTRALKSRLASDQRGFTLIELLVVVLIIGILAAIAIPAFLGQRTKAQDSAAKSVVRSATSAAEAYATDTNGSYASMTFAALAGIQPTLADTGSITPVTANQAIEVVGPSADGYTVYSKSKSGTIFNLTKVASGADKGKVYRCKTATACASNSGW